MIPLLEAIKTLLWERWDPIGVNDTDCPRDEYDPYAFEVWKMLMAAATVEEIDSYLSDLEQVTSAFSPTAVDRNLPPKERSPF